MAFIDGTVVNVALPALQSSLHATVVDVQWVVESYGLFLSALLLIGGAMGDSVGRRSIFLLGTGVFAAASVGCGLSSNITQLIVARCVQGIGAAFLVPSSLAIISASFDEKSRGQAIGTWSGFTAITTALGPVLGGWLIEHASWHWVFFINVPLGAAVIAISLWHVPESRSSTPQNVDWLGAWVATVGLAGMVFGFVESAYTGLEALPRPWKCDRWVRRSHSVCIRRKTRSLTHGSAFAVQITRFQRRECADIVALCCAGNFLFSLSAQLDPGAEIFDDRHWGRRFTINFAHIFSFPLVGRTRGPLRSEGSAYCWAVHRRGRLPLVRLAICRGLLLDDLLSRLRCSRFWYGRQRRAFDDRRHELCRSNTLAPLRASTMRCLAWPACWLLPFSEL
jgi:MFS family permease